jgi:hypothetical protein
MNKRKIVAWTALSVFLAIQFIRPRRNNDEKAPGLSFIQLYEVPDSVNVILEETCFDCHSNHTRYPWYTNIQPFGWIMAKHIRRGKAELNFNDFKMYPFRRQISKLKAIASQVEDNKMPLKSYKLLHKRARIPDIQKKMIVNWMRNKADSISTISQ